MPESFKPIVCTLEQMVRERGLDIKLDLKPGTVLDIEALTDPTVLLDPEHREYPKLIAGIAVGVVECRIALHPGSAIISAYDANPERMEERGKDEDICYVSRAYEVKGPAGKIFIMESVAITLNMPVRSMLNLPSHKITPLEELIRVKQTVEVSLWEYSGDDVADMEIMPDGRVDSSNALLSKALNYQAAFALMLDYLQGLKTAQF